MLDFKHETFAFFSKIGALLFYVFIGIVAKFSLDLVQGKKITFLWALGSTGISLFIGFLSAVICMNHKPEMAPYVVPIATLCADKIILVLVNIDWGKTLNKLLYLISKKP